MGAMKHIGKPWMPVGGVFQDAWKKPFGTVGDRLWVRETWRCRGGREYEYQKHQPSIMYCADAEPVEAICNEWRPSIHMPRWASRIDLEITRVWVERVQDITEEDAVKEGVTPSSFRIRDNFRPFRSEFRDLWQSIYGNRPTLPKNPESKRYHRVKRWLDKNPPTGWDANPWVWAYEFRRIKP